MDSFRRRGTSNDAVLRELMEGSARFEIVQPPATSSFASITASGSRFFARIGSPLSPAMKKLEHYSVVKVVGDGRCMFRALVKGMARNKGLKLSPHQEKNDADDLRMAVKEVVCDSGNERSQYEEALIAVTAENSLQRYCQLIARSDFWGGEAELLVLSKLCRQPVTVYIPAHEHAGGGHGYIPIAEYGAEFKKGSPKGKPREPSNGGMLYHEVQESKLCAVHCVNTVLQGPFFSEFDLAALASDLDRRERQMLMIETDSGNREAVGDFLSEDSHNVSMDGDFSIQVLQKALQVWDLQVIPFDSPELNRQDPEKEEGFICHLQNHWFCIRKVNGEWYNFNSLYPAPEHLTKFYLAAYLDSLKSSGWTIFVVKGNFPRECSIPSSDASNGFGQWLTPDDAERITKSCNQKQDSEWKGSSSHDANISQEEADLNAAIRASLVETTGFTTLDSSATASLSDEDEAKLLNAAIEASLADPSEAIFPGSRLKID